MIRRIKKLHQSMILKRDVPKSTIHSVTSMKRRNERDCADV